jgi:hypothetical protein
MFSKKDKIKICQVFPKWWNFDAFLLIFDKFCKNLPGKNKLLVKIVLLFHLPFWELIIV